jgi:hypothetical protein
MIDAISYSNLFPPCRHRHALSPAAALALRRLTLCVCLCQVREEGRNGKERKEGIAPKGETISMALLQAHLKVPQGTYALASTGDRG